MVVWWCGRRCGGMMWRGPHALTHSRTRALTHSQTRASQDIFSFLDCDADGTKDGHLDFDSIHPVFDLLLLFSTGMEQETQQGSVSMETLMRSG